MKDISAADTAENVAAVNADDPVSAGKKPEERKGTSLFVYLLTYLFRLGIGAVFIFSGYVKAIDPWGTIYKFKEYFAAMGIGCSDSQMVVLAFALFSLEFAAGVALVTGSYRKWAPRLGLFFMLLMLPLTLWLAIAEPVADCGCFGDAVILTNWQTFWKNVAITLALVWLCFFNGRIRCIIIPTLQVWSICLTLAFVIFIGFIGYASQPMVDYRPYKVGESLLPEEEEELDYQSVWSDGKTQITLPADSIPEGEQWEFVKRLETSPAKKSKGLVIYDGQEDVTEDVICLKASR